jgi:hypothetical protein
VNVFQSLYTPGYLVRTPKGEHGVVHAFDHTTNMVTVKVIAAGMYEAMLLAQGVSKAAIDDKLRSMGALRDYSLLALRAGNDDSEEKIIGSITKRFPKCL